MKPTQTVLLLVALVVLVFAVTFASMYVRQDATDTKSTDPDRAGPDMLSLTFRARFYPEPRIETRRQVTEYGKTAYHDFWFENANDEGVAVGLHKKNCTCTSVSVCIAPDGWRAVLDRAKAARY